ncbi:MAG: hypothetical protein NTW21_07880 [Verrucomicrobia bacterium]|nr:hypothetical protein [Verrucomicrobiota bacterium]
MNTSSTKARLPSTAPSEKYLTRHRSILLIATPRLRSSRANSASATYD